jgi:dienelactone hydrolase
VAWKETRSIRVLHATQAAATDPRHFYAIDNSKVAKHDRVSGELLAISSGDAIHLNSGFLWEGKLVCAHSNFPATPERSQIKVLEPETMELTTFKEFGDFGGSLTWVVRQDESWWCNFARYGAANAETFLVQFDASWRELGRWTYPPEVIRELGRYSVSGGLWRGRLLMVTGHDDSVIFRLRLPEKGTELEFVDRQSAPFTGQGIAYDSVTHGLVGINRPMRRVIFANAESPLPSPRLPRENLMVLRGQDNRSVPAKSVDDWLHRRAEIQGAMQIVMGPLPGKEKLCPLDMKVEEEVDCGGYLRRLITYASEPGSRVPAYLCIPKTALAEGAKPVPGILCLHGTDNVVGHGVVVGLGSRPNRQYASELAELGFVTLAPSYPLLAKYQPDIYALGWESGTLKAVWDNMRGLDLLESLPYVKSDPTRMRASFGAIGHSLGGHNAVYTSVFDDRIAAVVSSCGLDSYLDYYDGEEKVWFPEKGWAQTRYMPRLAHYRGRLAEIPFDFHELIGALAPRHVLIVAPLRDSNFRAASVDRIAAAARDVFHLYGLPDRLRVEHPDCDHDFPVEMRQASYNLFQEVLQSK